MLTPAEGFPGKAFPAHRKLSSWYKLEGHHACTCGPFGCGRTSKQVISTGMTVPTLSWVAALYSLQNAMMFSPCNGMLPCYGLPGAGGLLNRKAGVSTAAPAPWHQEQVPQGVLGWPCRPAVRA